ncbi:uncharacterized protein BJ171DRAFT_578577 [Polychytrium aggregatum]|uniref:uncharacterized protein n=1 Tax=Polychytrium aggregatum TaxID=110093 RepID=UPI0022FE3428|nr:uncharacterized protein BJ171DRAFT_578577 [Polychytrium aggregatum]KAI9207458.1 hypothetical protein BJ171DRAFT_578577 [Polychytrium aggregatum]
MYSHRFSWPADTASQVIITGEWDDWNGTHYLKNTGDIFETEIQFEDDSFEAGHRVAYKYIVDGVWLADPKEPKCKDERGFENNCFIFPEAKKKSYTDLSPQEVLASIGDHNANGKAPSASAPPAGAGAGASPQNADKSLLALQSDETAINLLPDVAQIISKVAERAGNREMAAAVRGAEGIHKLKAPLNATDTEIEAIGAALENMGTESKKDKKKRLAVLESFKRFFRRSSRAPNPVNLAE